MNLSWMAALLMGRSMNVGPSVGRSRKSWRGCCRAEDACCSCHSQYMKDLGCSAGSLQGGGKECRSFCGQGRQVVGDEACSWHRILGR